MHSLVIAPTYTHPQTQGNSARIYQVCRSLQRLGHKVHFIYVNLEGITEQQRKEMSSCWDFFYCVQPTIRTDKKSLGDVFGLDDWYEPEVGKLAKELHKKWEFSHCIVNYVWQSAALECLPDDVNKIIDTHDIFGDRHLIALQAGMEPSWFYTSVAEEIKGLNRANVVIAIQDVEKQYFSSIGIENIVTIGYAPSSHFLSSRLRKKGEKIQVGFIASGNPWNIKSFLSLHEELENYPDLLNQCEFILAGAICREVAAENHVFKIKGFVKNLESFYRAIDIVLNPMIGGTGLKIKTVEALVFGKPLISTCDGMVGIPSREPSHQCKDMKVFCEELANKIKSLDNAEQTANSSIEIFKSYSSWVNSQFEQLVMASA